MLFAEVVGQEGIKQKLWQMAQHRRMPHALLLLGAPGSGHLPLALALAQYLLCENPAGLDACGHCRHCHKTSKLLHPDVHFSFPTVGTNAISDHFSSQWRTALLENPYMDVNQWLQLIGAENRQGNITKEECVSIVKKLSLKTFESDYKILIQWLPEYLGKEGNRLLKIIEEPPANTIFILVAEQAELILPTILSRCQIVKVNPLSDEEVIEGLTQRRQTPRERAEAIAHLTSGNFNEALQVLEKEENDLAVLFLDWLRKCYRGNGVEMVNWVEKNASIGRENQKYFLRYALHFLREYLALKLTSSTRLRLRLQETATAQNLLSVIEPAQAMLLAELFNECVFHVERNANPKVLWLDASISVHKILKGKITALNAGNRSAAA